MPISSPILNLIPKTVDKPFIIATWAQSINGIIGSGTKDRIIISGDESFALTLAVRKLSHGILIGINTLLCDNPRLTTRDESSRCPIPIILDSDLRTEPTSRVFSQGHEKVIVITSSNDKDRTSALKAVGATVAVVKDTRNLTEIVPQLVSDFEIGVLMVEGGGKILNSFLSSGMVDLAIVTISPLLIDSGIVVKGRLRLVNTVQEQFGQDVVIAGIPEMI